MKSLFYYGENKNIKKNYLIFLNHGYDCKNEFAFFPSLLILSIIFPLLENIHKAFKISVTLGGGGGGLVYRKVDVNMVLIDQRKPSTNVSYQNTFADMSVTRWRTRIKTDYFSVLPAMA